MEINGAKLTKGKFYLWEVATQQGTGVVLNSVYFVTDDKKVYEVVFTKPNEGGIATGWYLVETKHEVKKHVPEAEVVENAVEEVVASDPNTLSIQVEDELKLGEQIGG